MNKQNKPISIERFSDFYWEEANHLSIGAQIIVYISFQLEIVCFFPVEVTVPIYVTQLLRERK
jgi:hypothetical protein